MFWVVFKGSYILDAFDVNFVFLLMLEGACSSGKLTNIPFGAQPQSIKAANIASNKFFIFILLNKFQM
ncbi:hypothetical protein QM027_10675 [Campylobacter concisus]